VETKFYGNDIVEIVDDGIVIHTPDDVLDLLFINNCSTILLKKENIIEGFFNLSTGIAGEILQKFSNYRKKLAIIGDFENIESKSLRDFIYESNRTKQIVFVKTMAEALDLFGG
jgi:hypothetical protein